MSAIPPVDRATLLKTLQDLVRINSINPTLAPGAPGEAAIADYVESWLKAAEVEVARHETSPGRPSVVGILRGNGGGRSLMLSAHLDTVDVRGMKAAFSGEYRDGRVYGRGAYDMKGSLAACMVAVAALRQGHALRGDVLLTAVADEEDASLGTQDILHRYHADAAIVTEPTQLQVCLAHKGFCWLEVETFGVAAHGSRPEDGVDANMQMGQVLAHLRRLQQRLNDRPAHPLLGHPSLHAAQLHGGTGASTYAAHCRLLIERRTVPGETSGMILEEVGEILGLLSGTDPDFRAGMRVQLSRDPFEVQPTAEIVQTLSRAAEGVLGRVPDRVGEMPWMDSALLAAAGIETVVFGPIGSGAHADVEWVDVDSVVCLAEILRLAAQSYCG
ncbi:MAG: M20/M25/M40 family metallo-hydrolase [Gemmatimonadota bacterium]